MSKAIEGAALLGTAVAIGVLSLGSGAAAAWAVSAAGVNLMEGAAVAGGSMLAGSIASALTDNRGMNITTRQAAANRQIIYGQQRVGGVQIYRNTTGAAKSNFNYVIVLAGHECDSIVNLYLDGRQVHWQVGSVGNSTRNGVNFGGTCDANSYTGPNGVQYNFQGNTVYCEARYGDQLPGDVIGGLTANDPVWAADADGSPYVGGCCYVYLKLEGNSSVFQGEPEIRFTVNGKNNIFDPRTGTTGYTANSALIAADIITDPVFGLNDNSVNEAQLIAAANVCDEQVDLAIPPGNLTESRYTAHYHYDTGTTPGNALGAILDGMAGRLSRIGGEWWIFPAYWVGPTFSFDENALAGPAQWEGYRSFDELVNVTTGTYTAPTCPYSVAGNLYDQNGFYNGQLQNNFPFGWQPTSIPQYAQDPQHGYTVDQNLEDDGGQRLPEDHPMPSCISVAQAQRVLKIYLLRNRQQGSGTFPMFPVGYRMQANDVMQFSFAENNWVNKYLEISGTDFEITDSGEDGVQMVHCTQYVRETAPEVYEWDQATEELDVYGRQQAA